MTFIMPSASDAVEDVREELPIDHDSERIVVVHAAAGTVESVDGGETTRKKEFKDGTRGDVGSEIAPWQP